MKYRYEDLIFVDEPLNIQKETKWIETCNNKRELIIAKQSYVNGHACFVDKMNWIHKKVSFSFWIVTYVKSTYY